MRRALFLAILLAGCSEPAAPPADLSGEWAEPISVPGAGFGFTLTQVGDSVSGVGMYFIEAGAHGTLTVRGRYVRPDVQLQIAQDSRTPFEFVGQVQGSRMTGTATDSLGQSRSMTLVRQ
jgi:hypothetical protein